MKGEREAYIKDYLERCKQLEPLAKILTEFLESKFPEYKGKFKVNLTPNEDFLLGMALHNPDIKFNPLKPPKEGAMNEG